MIDVKIALRGERELRRTMDTFKQRVQGRITRQVTRAMARPVIKAVRKRIPTQSKLLRKSIGVKVWFAKRSGLYLAYIGPRTKMGGTWNGKRRIPTRYAHLLERGYTSRSGRHIPPVAPLRKGLAESKAEALRVGRDKARQLVAKEVAKMAAKGGK